MSTSDRTRARIGPTLWGTDPCSHASSDDATSRRDFLARMGLLGLGVALAPGALDGPRTRGERHGAAVPAPVEPTPTCAFHPAGPLPLADTRSRFGYERISPDTIRVATRGVAGTPRDAAAVAVTLGVIAGDRPGFLTVWPAGTPRPSTRALSFAAHQRTAGSLHVQASAAGIDIHHSEPVELLVDLAGAFAPVRDAAAGRYVPLDPVRILDTRGSGPLRGGDAIVATRPPAIPPDAVAVTVVLEAATASGAAGAGTWTLYPADATSVPAIAQLRLDPTVTARRTSCTVRLTPAGVAVATSVGGHATLDIVGYFTGASAARSASGLFVPGPPTRALDTRDGTAGTTAGSLREMAGPGEGIAWAATFTAFPPSARPHGAPEVALRALPAGLAPGGAGPGVAVIEPQPRAATTGFAAVARSTRGTLLEIGFDGDLAVDSYGWFTGEPPPARNPADARVPYGIDAVVLEEHADEWLDYGLSTDARPLRAFRLGSGRRHAMVLSHLHGDEWTGESVIADLAARGAIDGWTLWLLPDVNPDARAANRRFAHGVNMNRDFGWEWQRQADLRREGCVDNQTGPTAYTLVESRRLRDVIENHIVPCEIVVSHHDNYDWVAPASLSGASDEVAAALRAPATAYARAVGLRVPGDPGPHTSNTWTRVPGGFESWMRSVGRKALLVENRTGATTDNGGCGWFGVPPARTDVAPHRDALRALLAAV